MSKVIGKRKSRLLLATAAVVITSSAVSAGAQAATPVYYPIPACTANASETATIAAKAGLSAVTGAGVSGLASSRKVTFSFASKTCGGYRFLLRVRDPRPGKKGRKVTIGYSTAVNYLSTIEAGQQKQVSGRITANGLGILKYAKAHKAKLRTLVITHVRASNSSTSVQVIAGILLK